MKGHQRGKNGKGPMEGEVWLRNGANSYVQKMLLVGVLLLIFIAFTEIFIK